MLFLWQYLNVGECTVFVFKPHLKDRLRECVCYQPLRHREDGLLDHIFGPDVHSVANFLVLKRETRIFDIIWEHSGMASLWFSVDYLPSLLLLLVSCRQFINPPVYISSHISSRVRTHDCDYLGQTNITRLSYCGHIFLARRVMSYERL